MHELDAVSRKELSAATGRKGRHLHNCPAPVAIWFCAKFKIGPKDG